MRSDGTCSSCGCNDGRGAYHELDDGAMRAGLAAREARRALGGVRLFCPDSKCYEATSPDWRNRLKLRATACHAPMNKNAKEVVQDGPKGHHFKKARSSPHPAGFC